MRFCESCGNKLEKEEKFCSKCGKKAVVEKDVKTEKKQTNTSQEPNAGVGSVVLGIVSIVLSFILFGAPIALILSIIGVVLAAKNKVKSGTRTAGLVLNIIGIVLSIIMTFALILLIIGLVFVNEASENGGIENIEKAIGESFNAPTSDEIAGVWECKKLSSLTSDPVAKLTINDNYTFTLEDYNNPTSNYVKGTYDFEDDAVQKSFGYALELDGEIVVEGGERQLLKDYDYDFVVTKYNDSVKGVLTNDDTTTAYYCSTN